MLIGGETPGGGGRSMYRGLDISGGQRIATHARATMRRKKTEKHQLCSFRYYRTTHSCLPSGLDDVRSARNSQQRNIRHASLSGILRPDCENRQMSCHRVPCAMYSSVSPPPVPNWKKPAPSSCAISVMLRVRDGVSRWLQRGARAFLAIRKYRK